MYIGLDVGTSSVKAVLFSEEGKVLKKASKSYPVHGENGELELDPLEVKDAAFFVLGQVVRYGKEIRSIGISSLGEAAVLLGKDDQVLGRAILPGDRRGTKEAEALKDKDILLRRTGLPVNGTYTVCKILWLKEKRPDIYRQIRRVMLFGDYIGWCLTKERKVGHSLASRTMAFDLEQKEFFSPAEGIDPDWFSAPAPADACVGRILPKLAQELHLPGTALVFAGGHDQPCAAAGTGAIQRGWASDSIGTSECITANLGTVRLREEVVRENNFACEPFLQPGIYNTMAYTHTAGKLVEWLYRKVAGREPGCPVYGKEEAVPTGLLILPHFAGSGTPYMDPMSTGAVIGLDLHTDLELLYRGILENICYEMKQNLLLWKERGIECSRVTAVGGGTKSDLWLQYKADIYEMPVCVAGCEEASALGAAIASAVGAGDFDTWEQAVSAMVSCQTVYYPDEKRKERFREAYGKYSRLYESVKNINKS